MLHHGVIITLVMNLLRTNQKPGEQGNRGNPKSWKTDNDRKWKVKRDTPGCIHQNKTGTKYTKKKQIVTGIDTYKEKLKGLHHNKQTCL